MNYDIGMICQACGSVTIFQSGSDHPRRCARCTDRELAIASPSSRERPTWPSGQPRQLDVAQLDWRD